MRRAYMGLGAARGDNRVFIPQAHALRCVGETRDDRGQAVRDMCYRTHARL